MELLDGKALSERILSELEDRVQHLKKLGIVPRLVFFLIGDNRSSIVYVAKKRDICKRVGMLSEIVRLPGNVATEAVVREIERRNSDPRVHGIMVQLRLPDHLDERVILQCISPEKDVDGLTDSHQADPIGPGRYAAATARGVMMMLDHYKVDLAGKRVVLLGRTNLFGIPFKKMVEARGPSALGYYGRDWKEHLDELKQADVVVSAIGEGRVFITPEMTRENVVCVDVGLGPDFDVEAFLASDKKGWITPTKGGTGPMTVASIVLQTVEAAERSQSLSTNFGRDNKNNLLPPTF